MNRYFVFLETKGRFAGRYRCLSEKCWRIPEADVVQWCGSSGEGRAFAAELNHKRKSAVEENLPGIEIIK